MGHADGRQMGTDRAGYEWSEWMEASGLCSDYILRTGEGGGVIVPGSSRRMRVEGSRRMRVEGSRRTWRGHTWVSNSLLSMSPSAPPHVSRISFACACACQSCVHVW